MRTPRPPRPAGLAARLRLGLATCGGVGYSPFAPGTFGTLVGLAAILALVATGLPWRWTSIGAAVVLAPLSIAIGTRCVRDYTFLDPSWFVLDEAAGIAVALACGPGLGLIEVAAAVMCFRVLDVIKPPPIAQLEHLPGGYGITCDDLAAGAGAGGMAWGVAAFARWAGVGTVGA